jgi:hypothetical protein
MEDFLNKRLREDLRHSRVIITLIITVNISMQKAGTFYRFGKDFPYTVTPHNSSASIGKTEK